MLEIILVQCVAVCHRLVCMVNHMYRIARLVQQELGFGVKLRFNIKAQSLVIGRAVLIWRHRKYLC